MSDFAQKYPYDPTTGKKLMYDSFPVCPLEPMTQKQVDYQYRLVNQCLEISEEEEIEHGLEDC